MNVFLKIIPKLLIILFFSNSALSSELEFEKILTDNFKLITKSSSKTVEPVIEKLLSSNFSKVEELKITFKKICLEMCEKLASINNRLKELE